MLETRRPDTGLSRVTCAARKFIQYELTTAVGAILPNLSRQRRAFLGLVLSVMVAREVTIDENIGSYEEWD